MRRAPRQPARSPAPRLDTHKRSPASLLRSTFDGLSTAGLEQMSRSRNLPLRRHHAPKPPPSQGPRGKDLCKAQRVAPWPLGNPPPRARFAGSSAKRPAPSSLGLLARRLSGGDAGGPAPTRPRGPRCSACQDGRPLKRLEPLPPWSGSSPLLPSMLVWRLSSYLNGCDQHVHSPCANRISLFEGDL